MKKAIHPLFVVLLGVATILGCSAKDDAQPSATTTSQPDNSWKEGLDEDVVKDLSQLSDADRVAALAQKVCPVSDKPLGSMGKPPKFTVEGQEVFLCCDSCEGELRKDASKYLAKLKSN